MGEHRGQAAAAVLDRAEFAGYLASLDMTQFARTALACVSGSAADAADPGSGWHWMSAAVWDETVRRGCPELYARMVRWVSGDPSVQAG